MRKHIRSIVGAAMLLTALSANAQLINRAHVNVPFSFAMGGTTAPAGNYLVSLSEARDRVTISNGISAPLVLLTTRGPQLTETRSHVAFRRSGGQWILKEVTVAGITLRVGSPSSDGGLVVAAKPFGGKMLSADLKSR